MKTAGIVLTVLGAIGTLVFGINAISESESFEILGLDIAVSSANWAPVIISVFVLVIGIIMMSASKRT